MASRKIVAAALEDTELQVYVAEFFIHQRQQTRTQSPLVLPVHQFLQLLDRQVKTTQTNHQSRPIHPRPVIQTVARFAARRWLEQANTFVKPQRFVAVPSSLAS